MRVRGRSGAALALIGLASLGACDSSTTIGVAPDVATSLSIVVAGGGTPRVDQLVLEVGDTVTLAAVAINPLGLTVPAGPVMWSSTDPSVADIDDSGLVTAVGVGSAEVRAAAGEAVSSIPTVVNDSATFSAVSR